MVMDADFSADCTSTINVATSADLGANNTPTHATPVAVLARQVQATKKIQQPNGTVRVATHKLTIPVSTTLTSLNDAAWVWLAADASSNPSVTPPSDAAARAILEFTEAWDPETLALSHWIVRV